MHYIQHHFDAYVIPRNPFVSFIHMQFLQSQDWIRTLAGHPGNERADESAKTATERLQVDVVIKLTTIQAKKIPLACALENWQTRWDHSSTGTYEIFPKISHRRLPCDFYINQILTGYGTFGDHQAHLRKKLNCPCGTPASTIQYCLYVCLDGKLTSRGTIIFECGEICVWILTSGKGWSQPLAMFSLDTKSLICKWSKNGSLYRNSFSWECSSDLDLSRSLNSIWHFRVFWMLMFCAS